MIQSLLMKLGMLVLTMGVVFWIGWHSPGPPPKGAASVDDSYVDPLALSPVTAESKTGLSSRFNNGPIAAKSGASNDANAVGGAAPSRVLDLNSATAEDLESLPGIGAVLAERVIAYRAAAGRFHMVEDLRAVKGIGSRKFDRIKPLVTVAAADAKGKMEKQPL